jgi:hypothetical protein
MAINQGVGSGVDADDVNLVDETFKFQNKQNFLFSLKFYYFLIV